MFGAQYFGELEPASAHGATTPTQTGGGGWSHRGTVTLPKKRFEPLGKMPTMPRLPSLPKAPFR